MIGIIKSSKRFLMERYWKSSDWYVNRFSMVANGFVAPTAQRNLSRKILSGSLRREVNAIEVIRAHPIRCDRVGSLPGNKWVGPSCERIARISSCSATFDEWQQDKSKANRSSPEHLLTGKFGWSRGWELELTKIKTFFNRLTENPGARQQGINLHEQVGFSGGTGNRPEEQGETFQAVQPPTGQAMKKEEMLAQTPAKTVA